MQKKSLKTKKLPPSAQNAVKKVPILKSPVSNGEKIFIPLTEAGCDA